VDVSPDDEIFIKGPNVMLHYHNKPEDIGESLRDGWMHSGDVPVMDADWRFPITDLIKDILITLGGKNITPSTLKTSSSSLPTSTMP